MRRKNPLISTIASVLVVLILGTATDVSSGQPATVCTVWFGTGGDGIYRSVLDLDTGKLTDVELAAELTRPGFLALNREGTRLYAVCRCPDHTVASFAIGEDRTLRELNRQSTGSAGSTHVSLSRDEKTLLVAHYSGGAVAALPIGDDGTILPSTSVIQHAGSSVTDRQKEPHPHWIGATPDNRFVMVPDLGIDQVVIYKLDATAHVLKPHGVGAVPAGSGPRHLAFHPHQSRVYVINELSLTVTGFDYNVVKGSLNAIGTYPALPSENQKVPNYSSEIQIHPNGKFLYAGLRGHDTIAVFAIDADTGGLRLLEHEPIRGSWPRHFGIDPTGKWLVAAGAKSNTATVFEIDQQSGELFFTGHTVSVPEPTCVVFQPQ